MEEEMMLVRIVWSNFLALTSSFEKVTTRPVLQSSHDGHAALCLELGLMIIPSDIFQTATMKGTGDKVCCTFTTYNVLATLFGLLVVAVASWLAADKISFFTELKLVEESVSQEFAQISVVDYGAFILVAIGVAIVIQSILGCTGTMMGCSGNSKARTFLISYGVLVALVVVCEIVAAILVLYVYKGKISAEAKSFMKKTIKEDYRVEGEISDILLQCSVDDWLFCCRD